MTTGSDDWLERIASAADLQARARVYDSWAATFDADMVEVNPGGTIVLLNVQAGKQC